MSAPAVLDESPQTLAARTTAEAGETTGAPAWTPRPIPAEQVFRLDFVTWDQYVAIADALPNRHVFVTYDKGTLQLMTTGAQHENLKCVVALLTAAAADAVGVDLRSMGNPTYRRAALARGFEPDHVYYVELDRRSLLGHSPEQLPPPDLALEIEVSATVLDRLPLYAAVGVPEVWRIDGENGLTFLRLEGGAGGAYREIDASELIAGITPDMVWDAALTLPAASDLRYQLAAVDFFSTRLAGE
ncbi:Uma2 family endonuclease [Alienimonas chondri]|uniref:Putative restriction endonuclease domain-containing protein n=1 Tax=Alienimonas chondri TaxID=2681879 RepID=A0ABX1VCU9_9PLAN|nr:Uma2 family endonuclease [Alienimonas chondri]NNJ25874.1 hypothetical protein [Alienimonas chondri]